MVHPKGGAPEGWPPKPRKKGGPKGGAPEGWGGPAFFPFSRHHFALFCLSGCLLVEFGGVGSAGALKCAHLEPESPCRSFLEPTRKPQVIYTNNSFGVGISFEDFSWNHCTFRVKGVSRIEEGTLAVLLQSGLDYKWWADFVECYCILRNI